MSTVSPRILNLLVNETHVGQYDTPEVLPLVQKIRLEDLDLLAANIPVLREHVIQVHAAMEQQVEEQRRMTRKKLEAFLKENQDLGINDVDTLISTLSTTSEGASQGSTKTRTKKATAKDNNTKFEVTLRNEETGKYDSFPVVNKMLSKKLREHPAYIALVKNDKNMLDVDNFLRAFSPEYAKRYEINAKYKTKTFHVNDQGKLNKQSQAFYQDYLKTNSDATTDDFRTFVKESYKKVD